MQILKKLLDLIYPEGLYCHCCDKIISPDRSYGLCNECMDGFKWATGRCCLKCGKPLSPSNPRVICYSCSEHKHNYHRGYTCTEYGTHERSLLYKLKYNGSTYVAPMVAEVMYDRMISLGIEDDYDILIPAPSHKSRALSRGYNQAELIAEELSRLTHIPASDEVLERISHTAAMRTLTPEQRRSQLQGVFAMKKGQEEAVRDKRVMLVDDIYTTGATADALSELLYSSGAARVDILSFSAGADVVK